MSKKWVKKFLVSSGAMRLASKCVPKGVAILMYHSVMDRPEVEANTLGGIIHSSGHFRAQMELIARRYNPVTLQDALGFVRGERDLPPRPVVVTFDDGYADNFQVASPILKQIGVPATFYITVECVEKQKYPWPARIRYSFLSTKKTQWIEPEGARWPLQNEEGRTKAFERAWQYCGKLAGPIQENFVQALEEELAAGPPAQKQRIMMSWEEVCGLVRDGHIVGSHTMTHPNMAHISSEDLNREFLESKCWLEKHISHPILHFSYPCPALQPHWAEHTVQKSLELGYESAVTTNVGLARKHDNPLCLRRILPTKDVEGLHWNLEYAFADRKS